MNLQAFHGCLEYLIHWHGYNVNEHMWKPNLNLVNTLVKAQNIYQQYPSKPRFMTNPSVTK